MADEPNDTNAVDLATELTIAWLGNPNTRASQEDVPAFLRRMHETVTGLVGAATATETAEPQGEYSPAVSVRKSLASKDHIISMIDGKPYKTLRRHISTYGLSPVDYRERYGLKSDYPMVAENYSESRRAMAKKIGLGRKPGQRADDAAAPTGEDDAASAATPAAKPGRRSRKNAAADAE